MLRRGSDFQSGSASSRSTSSHSPPDPPHTTLILPLVCQLQRMSRLFFCKSIFCPFTDRNTRRGQRYQGRRALPPSSTICGIRSGHTTTESSREEFSLLVHSFERAPVEERWVWLFVPCYLTQVRELTALSKTFSFRVNSKFKCLGDRLVWGMWKKYVVLSVVDDVADVICRQITKTVSWIMKTHYPVWRLPVWILTTLSPSFCRVCLKECAQALPVPPPSQSHTSHSLN